MTNITDILEMKARIVVAPENPFRMDSRALGDDVPRAGLTAAWRGPGARSPSVFKKGVTPPHPGPTGPPFFISFIGPPHPLPFFREFFQQAGSHGKPFFPSFDQRASLLDPHGPGPDR